MIKIKLDDFFEKSSANTKMEYLYLSLLNYEIGYVFAEGDDFVIYENSAGQLYLPIYPSISTANYAMKKNGISAVIEPVSLEELCEDVIPDLDNNDIFLGCYYDGKNGILISPNVFVENLE